MVAMSSQPFQQVTASAGDVETMLMKQPPHTETTNVPPTTVGSNYREAAFFRPASPSSVEDELAIPVMKLNELSMEEREQGLQDLHGVSDLQIEDPTFIQLKLREMRERLGGGGMHYDVGGMMTTTNHNAMTASDTHFMDVFHHFANASATTSSSAAATVSSILSSNPSSAVVASTIPDRELLKFLRAENLDPARAVERFNRYSTFQLNLFGKTGKLSYSDLSEQDKRYLASGFMQLLPQRDRAGRAILICLGSIKQQLRTPVESDLRCISFLASQAAEDEETQKRGLVMIYYAIAQKSYDGRSKRPLHLVKSFLDLPARVVSAHFCFDNPLLKPLLDVVSHGMEASMLCRFRSHCGQHVECQYNLMTFGIPQQCLPIDCDGQVDLTNHRLLLQTFQADDMHMYDSSTSSSNYSFTYSSNTTTGGSRNNAVDPFLSQHKFLIPSNMDIIMGRGQHAKNSPGHLRFKQMLEEHKEQYESVDKFQKTAVADLILQKLQTAGCRFLKPRNEGGWVQVSDDIGREKINHAFRNLRSSTRNQAAAAAAAAANKGISSSSSSRSSSPSLNSSNHNNKNSRSASNSPNSGNKHTLAMKRPSSSMEDIPMHVSSKARHLTFV